MQSSLVSFINGSINLIYIPLAYTFIHRNVAYELSMVIYTTLT